MNPHDLRISDLWHLAAQPLHRQLTNVAWQSVNNDAAWWIKNLTLHAVSVLKDLAKSFATRFCQTLLTGKLQFFAVMCSDEDSLNQCLIDV